MNVRTKILEVEYGMDERLPFKVGLTIKFENNDSLNFYGKIYYMSDRNDKINFYEISKEIVTILKTAGVFKISELIGKEVDLIYNEKEELMDIIFI